MKCPLSNDGEMPEAASYCSKDYPVQWVTGLPPQRCCPLRGQAAYNWLLQIYADYQRHHLPRLGGSLDQPAWLMDAISIIGEVVLQEDGQ